MAGLILDPAVPANAEALDLAALLLGAAAFFMIADAVQFAARGALQGLKDTAMRPWSSPSPRAGAWDSPRPWRSVSSWASGGPGIWAGMAVAMTGAAWFLIARFRPAGGPVRGGSLTVGGPFHRTGGM